MLNQDFLDNLFLEYFNDVDRKDEVTMRGCIDDFIDDAMRAAKAEAQQYLDDNLLPNCEPEGLI